MSNDKLHKACQPPGAGNLLAVEKNMCCNNPSRAPQWWRSTDRSTEGLAYLQDISESSFIPTKGKIKDLFSLFRSLIKGSCPKRGFDSLSHTVEMGNLHWMGKGGWLCNQPGRECSPLLSLMTAAPGTLPGRNQPGPSGSAVHRRRAHYKACPEFMACISKPVCAWAQGTQADPWRAGEQAWDTCWERQLFGKCYRMCWKMCCHPLGPHLHTPNLQFPSPCHLHPSLVLPWCVLTVGGALWDAHPWMSKQTDPTLDLHLRELTYAAVSFFKQKWQRHEVLSWYWDFAITWKLSWAWNRERGEIKLQYCWMDLHNKSISFWIATDGQSHPNQAMLGGHRVMHYAGPPQQVRQVVFVLVPLCVHHQAERQVVYSHSSRISGCLEGLADSSDYQQGCLLPVFWTPWSEVQDIPNILLGFAASGQNSLHCQSGCVKISKKWPCLLLLGFFSLPPKKFLSGKTFTL